MDNFGDAGKNSSDTGYIWYVCYGSNLLRERFLYYIKGGTYPVTGKTHRGCVNKTEPKISISYTLPYPMYFGNKSPGWDNGGAAFLDADKKDEAAAPGRAYLVTKEQFAEIWDQEGRSWYDHRISLGFDNNGIEFVTFTGKTRRPENPPSKKYLEVIKLGSIETAELPPAARTLFVYGTLMKGERNEHYLHNSVYFNDGVLRDYAIYNISWYPGIRPLQGRQVSGEIYIVPDKEMPAIYQLEGYEKNSSKGLYQKPTVLVETVDGRKIEAEVFVYNGKTDGVPLDGTKKWRSY